MAALPRSSSSAKPSVIRETAGQQIKRGMGTVIGAIGVIFMVGALAIGIISSVYDAVTNRSDSSIDTPAITQTPGNSGFQQCMASADLSDSDAEYYAQLDYCDRTHPSGGVYEPEENDYLPEYPARP